MVFPGKNEGESFQAIREQITIEFFEKATDEAFACLGMNAFMQNYSKCLAPTQSGKHRYYWNFSKKINCHKGTFTSYKFHHTCSLSMQ